MTAISSQQFRRLKKLPTAAIVLAALIFIIGGDGPNMLLALLSVSILLVGIIILWRPGEPPILLFTFCLPWLQASVPIFHANWVGISVNLDSKFKADMQGAIFLSLLGLVALILGMRRGVGPMRPQETIRARELALSQPISNWFRLYVGAIILSFIVLQGNDLLPGLSQVILALVGLKWMPYFILVYATFVRASSSKTFFILAFLLELALGTGGFFSEFRTVFIVTLLAILAAGIKYSTRTVIFVGLISTLLILFSVVWSAVKSDYRDFVSGGHNVSQSVNVDYTTRLTKLAELIGSIDSQRFARGADLMIARLAYVEFFSAVLNYVPDYVPHEDGAILLDAITRPLMPRMFFPEKSIIDDTERTNIYTGGLAGGADTAGATSISLGYIAESYIDFGKYGMMIELFGIGFCYGGIYRLFQKLRNSRGLLGMAMACAVLINVGVLDNSLTKVLGGVVVSVLMAWLLILAIPSLVPWLVNDRRHRPE